MYLVLGGYEIFEDWQRNNGTWPKTGEHTWCTPGEHELTEDWKGGVFDMPWVESLYLQFLGRIAFVDTLKYSSSERRTKPGADILRSRIQWTTDISPIPGNICVVGSIRERPMQCFYVAARRFIE